MSHLCDRCSCLIIFREIKPTCKFYSSYNPLSIDTESCLQTRGSQEPVIAHLANSCQDKEHIKTIRSNILPKFGSNWASSSKWTEYFNEYPIGWFRCSSHLGWQMESTNAMLKGIHIVTILPKFVSNWLSSSRKKDFSMKFP